MFTSSQKTTGFLKQDSMTHVFDSFRPPYLYPSEGHKHGVSIQSLRNLSKTFLRISPARNIAQTWIFARLFEYSSSFIYLILDFIFRMILMVVRQRKPAINTYCRIYLLFPLFCVVALLKPWNSQELITHCSQLKYGVVHMNTFQLRKEYCFKAKTKSQKDSRRPVAPSQTF